MGIWGVLSLYRSGELRNLTEVIQGCGTVLLAIQEVRWRRKSILDKTVQKPESTGRVDPPDIKWLESVEDLKKTRV
jgi:hypothetical protein